MSFKKFASSEGNVWKYIFDFEDAIAEAVLYQYESFYKRTVICCSVMCGCPVGCTFCGTGKKFIRNLTANEIVHQIDRVLSDNNIQDINDDGERFQIMFMSMGEPMLNWGQTELAIEKLNEKYPNAELLLSTIGVKDTDILYKIIDISQKINKVGLQFSIHKSNDEDRDKLIPFKNKLTLEEIKSWGEIWYNETKRHPYLNYCVDKNNSSEVDFKNLTNIFKPNIFNFTFSVICESNESLKSKSNKELDTILNFSNKFLEVGYNTRVFDPAGQDDIGGGCGQLWFVQDWMENHKREGIIWK